MQNATCRCLKHVCHILLRHKILIVSGSVAREKKLIREIVLIVDGTLSDIKFSKILNPLIDEETKRVMMSMRRWHCSKVNLLKARVRIGVNQLIHK